MNRRQRRAARFEPREAVLRPVEHVACDHCGDRTPATWIAARRAPRPVFVCPACACTVSRSCVFCGNVVRAVGVFILGGVRLFYPLCTDCKVRTATNPPDLIALEDRFAGLFGAMSLDGVNSSGGSA